VAYLILIAPQLAPVSALALSSLLGTTLLLVSHVAFTQGHLWLTPMLPLLGLIVGHASLLLWQLAARRWGATEPRPLHSTLTGRNSEDPFELSMLQEPPAPVSTVNRSAAQPPTPARPVAPAAAKAPAAGASPAPAAAPAAPPATAATPEAPNQRPITQAPNSRWPSLGRFQLDRELGHGAMGRVYLAHELETSRVVVIKTLSLAQEFEGISLQEARRRFLREAEAAGRLQHPNIVRIHETGEERGMAYIAMEWLHGRNLVLHTQMHNLLPVADVLEIGARIADALAYAHSQGVIHRDIKPANVMVDPSRGQVTVTDFGIARIIDGRSTRTGLMLGSPLYMSPEQLLGRSIDGRSDLYSLGVMLFQLLTGELPSRGDSIAELISAITTQEAPDVRTLRPDLPQPVAEVVALALEKQPELRYRNGQDLAADLRLVAAQLLQSTLPPAVSPPRPSAAVEDVASGSTALWPGADSAGAIVHNRHG
jgi:serine/threonine-protein kinase